MENDISQDIRVEFIDSISKLEQHASDWDALALAVPQKLPMLSHAWVSSYFEHRLTKEQSWFCLLAYRGNKLVGVLSVVNNLCRHYGIQCSFLHTPRDSHNTSGDILLYDTDKKYATKVFKRLIERAVDVIPSTACIEIRGVRENSVVIECLKKHCLSAVVFARQESRGRYIKVDGDFEEFSSQLSKNFKNNLRKARNKLTKLGSFEVENIRGEKANREHLHRFLDLEASGWKGKAGTAILLSPALVEYYSTLVERLSAKRWLEWHFLNINGRTIAAHLAVRFGEALLLLKIAYDESFSACAPGNILFGKIVESAFMSEDISEINCLTDMTWHLNWNMAYSNFYNLYIYPYGVIPLVGGLLPKLSIAAARRIIAGLKSIIS